MRPSKYNKSKKPQAFISNLYKLLQDQSNSQYVRWRDDQQSFIIVNICKFSEHILPRYYKHSNYSSFVRQLNMYNFTKVRTQMEGEHVFKNQQFAKNSWENLKLIKRREVTNNNKSNNGILALAQAIGDGRVRSNTDSDHESHQKSSLSYNNILQNSQDQFHHQQRLMQIAAPQHKRNMFQSPFILDSFHLPQLEKLKLDPLAQQFLHETQKIPSVLPLKPERKYFPLKTKVQELKSNQLQLQQVCVSLYNQNEFLTNQNKRLQQKLRNEFKKKQQILNQIIKYVINFLSEWNTGSNDLDDVEITKDHLSKDHVISDEQSSSSQIILESYDFLQKKKGFVNGMKQNRQQSDQKGLKFSKYAQNEKKILLTLLKQIEKSYNEKFFFTQGHTSSSTNHNQKNSHPDFAHYQQQSHYSSTSPNNFMMSMLLKFIESNNLVQVIKRFSLLINLQRNKKSKNFTVVNCMKDLKQRFELKQFQKTQSKRKMMMDYQYQNGHYQIEPQGLDHLHAKEMFLENEKETIKQMEKQLALITNPKTKSNKNKFLQNDVFESEDHQSSFLSFLTQKLQEQDGSQQNQMKSMRKNKYAEKQCINKYFA